LATAVNWADRYCHWLVSDDHVSHMNVPTAMTMAPVTSSDAPARERLRRSTHDTGASSATARMIATINSRMIPARCHRHHSAAAATTILKIVRNRDVKDEVARAFGHTHERSIHRAETQYPNTRRSTVFAGNPIESPGKRRMRCLQSCVF
jgi:hypothetical protein